jgi:hypothetical protein
MESKRGMMGIFAIPPFDRGTVELAKRVAESRAAGLRSLGKSTWSGPCQARVNFSRRPGFAAHLLV